MTAPTTTKLPPTDTGRCGTYSGYRRHAAIREHACCPCMDAMAAYDRQRRSLVRPNIPKDNGPLPATFGRFAGRDVMHKLFPPGRSQCAECFGWPDDWRHR